MSQWGMIKSGVIILGCLALTACGLPVRREKLEDKYVLFAADAPEDLSICREVGKNSCDGGVPATIAAVGMDGRYIVAAQHPDNNKSITRYYVIDLTVPQSEINGVTGPLTKAQFDDKRRVLDLPPLKWKVDDTYALDRTGQ